MLNPGTLFVGLLTSSVGVGYFIYGKRQSRYLLMVAGAVLCVLPFFVFNPLTLAAVSAVVAAAPFVFQSA